MCLSLFLDIAIAIGTIGAAICAAWGVRVASNNAEIARLVGMEPRKLNDELMKKKFIAVSSLLNREVFEVHSQATFLIMYINDKKPISKEDLDFWIDKFDAPIMRECLCSATEFPLKMCVHLGDLYQACSLLVGNLREIKRSKLNIFHENEVLLSSLYGCAGSVVGKCVELRVFIEEYKKTNIT